MQLLYASQSSFGGIKREIGKAPKRQDIIPGLKIVNEYDQELPQSPTAEKPKRYAPYTIILKTRSEVKVTVTRK